MTPRRNLRMIRGLEIYPVHRVFNNNANRGHA